MKTKLVTLLVVVVVLVAAGLLLFRPEDGASGTQLAGEVSLALPGGQKAVDPYMVPPDFFIIKKGEEPVSLSELRGKPVFINFWNTWCPPCRMEMPGLDRLYREYGQDVEFIFINRTSQEKNTQDVRDFLAENNYVIPVYLDRRGEVAEAYGVNSIPATVVINAAGEISYAAAGMISYEEAKSLITRQ